MPTSTPRSIAASVVGWAIVVLALVVFGGAIVGTLWWAFRIVLVIALFVGLIWLYLRLRGGSPEP